MRARGSVPARRPEALSALTDTEREILGFLAEMLTAEEIAVLMAISVSDVREHTRNILGKLASRRLNKAAPRGPNLRIVRG
jgi:LuxR family transcriptional regulator, maltose regulon positive regulatory protein